MGRSDLRLGGNTGTTVMVAPPKDAVHGPEGRPLTASHNGHVSTPGPFSPMPGPGAETLQVLCAGVSHRMAPLAVRERLSFPKEEIEEGLLRLRGYVGEGIIISTCNRTEIYTTTRDPEKNARGIRRFMAESRGVDPALLQSHVYTLKGDEAVRHLFRVASGLDSMILGESEVLGQVRRAFMAAAGASSPGVPLSRLFHYALRTGRRAREETAIGKNSLSVSYAGVGLVQRALGSLNGRTALLVGVGEAGRLVARALRTAGIGELLIANRTLSRAEALARELQGRPVPFDRRSETLEEVDIVIGCTGASGLILTRAEMAKAMRARGGRPVFLFDLAVPRDIDPEVASIEEVHLFDIDDLTAIAEENRVERERAAEFAEVIVEKEVESFSRWWRSLEAVPLIKKLRKDAEAIRRRELEKALRRLDGMGEEEIRVIERLTQSITNKLLHKPFTALKEPRAATHLREVREQRSQLRRILEDRDPPAGGARAIRFRGAGREIHGRGTGLRSSKWDRSAELYAEAKQYIPGGVNSPARSWKAVGGTPVFLSRARGSRTWDVDGNEYIDYVGSWGPLVLGHSHPGVLAKVKEAIDRGTNFGTPTELETELARRVVEACPSIDKVRFVNSGTEATMSALRLARAYTGRNKIVKFNGGYHGHADALLVKAGSGAATLSIPDSAGVAPASAQDTLVAEYNDLGSVEALFSAYPGEIACVIVEPVAGNMGVVPRGRDFCKGCGS